MIKFSNKCTNKWVSWYLEPAMSITFPLSNSHTLARLTCFQSVCIHLIQYSISGLRAIRAQYFIRLIKEYQAKEQNLSLNKGFFSSNIMYSTHCTMVKNGTRLLNPITSFGKNLPMPFNTVGHIPMQFNIHLLCFVT